MSKKSLKKKKRLAKADRRRRRVPPFATIRSKRKVTTSPKIRRGWRTEKLRIKEE